MTESVVAFVKLTEFAEVCTPVDGFTNSTIGIATKFVPVRFIGVAVDGAIV